MQDLHGLWEDYNDIYSQLDDAKDQVRVGGCDGAGTQLYVCTNNALFAACRVSAIDLTSGPLRLSCSHQARWSVSKQRQPCLRLMRPDHPEPSLAAGDSSVPLLLMRQLPANVGSAAVGMIAGHRYAWGAGKICFWDLFWHVS